MANLTTLCWAGSEDSVIVRFRKDLIYLTEESEKEYQRGQLIVFDDVTDKFVNTSVFWFEFENGIHLMVFNQYTTESKIVTFETKYYSENSLNSKKVRFVAT